MMDLPWEDNLLERKPESDLGDLLKTFVAFANSVRPGHTATVLIGELNDATAQGVTNPDNIQKKVRKTCDEIYPPILWRSHVYEKDGKPCVRVEIEYDGETPHFGGPAWVRRGSETIKATDEAFQRLIDFRSSKVMMLAAWLNQNVTVERELFDAARGYGPYSPQQNRYNSDTAIVRFISEFWVTFEVNEKRVSESLDKVTLSWDDDRERLKVIIAP